MKIAKRVVPAILTDDTAVLSRMLSQADAFTDYVQIDIMDGFFVPSCSVGWQEVAGLSFNLGYDAHLMVRNPGEYLEGFRKAGARRITFHFEADEPAADVVFAIKSLGLEAGLAVNPETPLEDIMPLVDVVNSVLFLSVNPGYYGSEFIPEVLEKIRRFRELKPDIEIGIDGGIKEDNILMAAHSGADSICVGSAVFMQPDPAQAYRHLAGLISEE